MPWIGYRKYVPDRDQRERFIERCRDNANAFYNKYWSAHRLKTRRNWTDKAIAEFLKGGRLRNIGYKNAEIMSWTLYQVEKAESQPEFQEWMAKRKAKQHNAAIRKGLREWEDGLDRLQRESDKLTPSEIHQSLHQLASWVLNDYPQLKDEKFAAEGYPLSVYREGEG